MTSNKIEYLEYLNSSADAKDWIVNMEDYVDYVEQGRIDYFEKFTTSFLVHRDDTLIVVFENATDISTRSDNCYPTGWGAAARHGWSYLAVISENGEWSESDALCEFVSNLASGGTRKKYQKIVILGLKDSCVAAHQCHVKLANSYLVIIQPEKGLSEALSDQEGRALTNQAADGNLGGFQQNLVVALDPAEKFREAFTANALVALRCWNFGSKTEHFLRTFDVTPALLEMTVKGSFDKGHLYKLLRKRREYRSYWRNVLAKIDDRRQPELCRTLCKNVLARVGGRKFSQKLTEI